MGGRRAMDDDGQTRPFIYSFITVRDEWFGALLFNPYLDAELALDPIDTYIARCFTGQDTVRRIQEKTAKRFKFTPDATAKRIYHAMRKLSRLYALGFKAEGCPATVPQTDRRRIKRKKGLFSSPKSVTWEVTSMCNLRCPHCYVDAGHGQCRDLDTDGAFRVIDGLAESRVLRLLISGGEPFLRPDIIDIIRKVSGTKMRLDIATNGMVLTDDTLKQMRDLPVFHIHVSIDGIGATHDRFRGQNGAFDRACETIARLHEENISVSLSTTVTRENINELEDIIGLALELGCDGFFANAMMPIGRGMEFIHRYKLDTGGYYQLYRTLVENSRELDGQLTISSETCFPFLLSPAAGGHASSDIMGCSAGRSTLCIGSDGTAYPCHFLHDFPLGNMLRDGIGTIWENSPMLDDLRHIRKIAMNGDCRTCAYAPGQCQGGCRAAAYYEFGDIKAMDPTCFKSIVE